MSVSGPGGYKAATLVSQGSIASGTTLVTVSIPAPNGSWDSHDNGAHTSDTACYGCCWADAADARARRSGERLDRVGAPPQRFP